MSLVPEHPEEDPEGEAEDYIRLEAGRAPAAVRPGRAPRPTVGVREPRRAGGGVKAAAAALKEPVGETAVDDVVGTPFPGVPDEPAIVRPLFEMIRAGVAGFVPPPGISRVNLENVVGQPLDSAANAVRAVAEEATSSTFREVMRGRGRSIYDTAPVAAIPLLRHLFKRRARVRPGVLGTRGPADPPSSYKPQRGSAGARFGEQGTASTRSPRNPAAGGARPTRVGGFGGMHVNVTQRMRELVERSR